MPSLILQVLQPAHGQRDFAGSLALLETELMLASKDGVDLLLIPELFACGYGDAARTVNAALAIDGPELAAVAAACRRWGVALVYTYPEQSVDGRFNAATVFAADGTLLAHYRKCRLPNPYERATFAAGTHLCRFTLGGVGCAILICYDVEFPELVRGLALAGSELLLVPTALAERWHRVATQLVPTRAYENGIFVAYANYAAAPGSGMAGLSCVCGPDGSDLSRLQQQPGRLQVTVDTREIARVRQRMPLLAMAATAPLPAAVDGVSGNPGTCQPPPASAV